MRPYASWVKKRTQRIDTYEAKFDGRTELGDGSVRFGARLSRIGVFDYGDHKELRPSEEVFSKEAIDSFKGIVVTDGHQGWVTPESWKKLAVGHVGDDVRRDGDFLVASIIIKDAAMLAKIDAGERVELSMGYEVDLDATPGRTDAGEEYDAIQRGIRGNHAALGPKDWGRAGSAVRLLDRKHMKMKMKSDPNVKEEHDPAGSVSVIQEGLRMLSGHEVFVSLAGEHADGAAYAPGMPPANQRIDAPSTNEDQKLEAVTKRADSAEARADRESERADKADKRADAASARADKAEAERDDLKTKLAKATEDSSKADGNVEKKIDEAIALRDSARVILGATFDFKGKKPREVHEAALKKADPEAKFDGKSDGYVEARFDLAVEQARKDQEATGAVNAATSEQTGGKGTPPKKSILDEAEEKADAEAKKAFVAGPPAGALFVRKA